jgi:endogenous inhibitor of DNA gyrase (YacG/DUF329 family)
MAKCANNKCDKEVVSIKGKRARKTCSDSCRVLFWKQQAEASKISKVVTIAREEYDSLIQLRDNPLINAKRSIDGSSADTLKMDEIGQSKELTTLASTTPKNMQELRDMCPKELIGIDRGNWISENRLKYKL